MQKPDDSTTKKASPTNNPFSQEELDALKTRDPRAYVKLTLKSQGSSTKKGSSSSTMFGGTFDPKSLDFVLR